MVGTQCGHGGGPLPTNEASASAGDGAARAFDPDLGAGVGENTRVVLYLEEYGVGEVVSAWLEANEELVLDAGPRRTLLALSSEPKPFLRVSTRETRAFWPSEEWRAKFSGGWSKDFSYYRGALNAEPDSEKSS